MKPLLIIFIDDRYMIDDWLFGVITVWVPITEIVQFIGELQEYFPKAPKISWLAILLIHIYISTICYVFDLFGKEELMNAFA